MIANNHFVLLLSWKVLRGVFIIIIMRHEDDDHHHVAKITRSLCLKKHGFHV